MRKLKKKSFLFLNMQASTTLFSPLVMGSITISNRIGMAALTRLRCDPSSGVPTPLHEIYYSQRASAGFILTECSQITPTGTSFLGSPGIHSIAQIEGWKKLTKSIQEKGEKIFLQIWHGGRTCHPELHGGVQPLSSFSIAVRDKVHTKNGKFDHVLPKEMTEEEIAEMVRAFRKGAENAKEAGFDGIELHGANGYLIDQFLRDAVNKRTDRYGGSVENRCRFPLEVIDQLIEVFGSGRIGMKVSPLGRSQDISDSDPISLYSYLFTELSKRNVAFVEVMEKGERFTPSYLDLHPKAEDQVRGKLYEILRPYFKGAYFANNLFDCESAKNVVESGKVDGVTFGRLFIANPDLVERFKNGWELNPLRSDYFYAGGEVGYSDYPFHEKK